MKYAIPVYEGRLSLHFGQSTEFALIDTDAAGNIIDKKVVSTTAHNCGATPVMLSREGVGIVLAGGMGYTPRTVFERAGIEVVLGITESDPEKAVKSHINQTLISGQNVCSHGDQPCGHTHGHGHSH